MRMNSQILSLRFILWRRLDRRCTVGPFRSYRSPTIIRRWRQPGASSLAWAIRCSSKGLILVMRFVPDFPLVETPIA